MIRNSEGIISLKDALLKKAERSFRNSYNELIAAIEADLKAKLTNESTSGDKNLKEPKKIECKKAGWHFKNRSLLKQCCSKKATVDRT